MKQYFIDMLYSESVFNTLYIEIKNANVKKISFGQNKRYKKIPFFLQHAATHHSFPFNLRFLHELKHKVRLSKTVCGIFHFRFCFVFINVYISAKQNAWTLDFKTSNVLSKLIEKPHTVLLPGLCFLSCNKKL